METNYKSIVRRAWRINRACAIAESGFVFLMFGFIPICLFILGMTAAEYFQICA